MRIVVLGINIAAFVACLVLTVLCIHVHDVLGWTGWSSASMWSGMALAKAVKQIVF